MRRLSHTPGPRGRGRPESGSSDPGLLCTGSRLPRTGLPGTGSGLPGTSPGRPGTGRRQTALL